MSTSTESGPNYGQSTSSGKGAAAAAALAEAHRICPFCGVGPMHPKSLMQHICSLHFDDILYYSVFVEQQNERTLISKEEIIAKLDKKKKEIDKDAAIGKGPGIRRQTMGFV